MPIDWTVPPKMTEAERQKISAYIESEFGIQMPAIKKGLLEGRLAKRLRSSGFTSYGEYFDFVTTATEGRDEFLSFADLVSTHETSFFRESSHFQYLEDNFLPALCRQTDRSAIRVLSAACSSGEEAYTIGMVVDGAIRKQRKFGLDFLVEGVDMSTPVVALAQRGVYLADRTKTIPAELRQRYLMVSKDRQKDLHRFIPELRSHLVFHPGNLLGDLNLTQAKYDVIFCRNVLIYFNPENQRRVIGNLLRHMSAHALLFLGHSETLIGLEMPVKSVAPGVFQHG